KAIQRSEINGAVLRNSRWSIYLFESCKLPFLRAVGIQGVEFTASFSLRYVREDVSAKVNGPVARQRWRGCNPRRITGINLGCELPLSCAVRVKRVKFASEVAVGVVACRSKVYRSVRRESRRRQYYAFHFRFPAFLTVSF